jgi:hypothetical protein
MSSDEIQKLWEMMDEYPDGGYEVERDYFGMPIKLHKIFYDSDNYPPNLNEIQVNDSNDPDHTGLDLEAEYIKDAPDDQKRMISIRAENPDQNVLIILRDADEVKKMAEWLTAAAKWMSEKKDIDWLGLRQEMHEKSLRDNNPNKKD